ncbi:MAG TPA: RHS repeat-associated core domain-containing protein [Pyrinomonadaceae bacterium]|nr:RHS repeat-associated core domain-containing protein [Pyrinomonadaceae bacterium]
MAEYQNGATETGSQNFAYDRWGNRTISSASGIGINNKSFTVNVANNRLGVPSGQSGAMTYDAAGNLTTDTYSGSAVSRAYDGENRMISETQSSGAPPAASYNYNADGQRVRRKVGAVETWQVYGIDGELLAEYAATGAVGGPQKEYGYRNGELLVTAEPAANLRWLVTDHLGTSRIIADQTGSLAGIKRHDYLPFGEELYAGTGGRTTAKGYSGDNVRQKFTSKERDNETGLDYFLARYYSLTQGRFTSPDIPFMDQWESNPQSWNLYSYVRNNPLAFVDPTGNVAEIPCDTICQESKRRAEEEGIDIITIPMVDSGVPRDGGGPNLTIAEALQQQEDRRRSFVVNNLVAGIGYGIGRAVRGIAGFFRGGSKAIPGTTPGLPASAPKPLGRGSTGRTIPRDLTEQLAIEEVMSNPTSGRPVPLTKGMTDPRWPASDGWIKMRKNVNGTEIHYVRNTRTGEVDDFKFVDGK